MAAEVDGYLPVVTNAPALQIETRDELVSLLHEAAELEHGLVCSYLFTACTLKEDGTEDLSGQQAEAVTRWRGLLTSVALEEMLHLALVSNLLTALGAAPHLRRPAFPQSSRYYPGGITIELRRFSDTTITRFIHLERPEGVDIEEEVLSDQAVQVDADAPEVAPGALRAPHDEVEEVPTEAFSTVGHLYQAIEDGLCHLVEQRGEDAVFIGPPRAQATATDFQLPDLVAVTDLESARRAVEVLVVQGEGVRGDWTDAHYGKFLRVREELRALQADDGDFDPARPVLANPAAHIPVGGADGRLVEEPITAAVMTLCNGCYELMTAMLLRFFSHTDESDDALGTLVQRALGLMSAAIRPLGMLLTTLPAGAGHGEATAGPSFEVSRPASLTPHRRAAWLVLHERLMELAAFAGRIAEDGGPDVLVEIAEQLSATARGLEPHLERSRIRRDELDHVEAHLGPREG
ncbi:MAG: ferritin-like protein [Acidimicrobiia bacterium]|nr:ferritin-like protein [Acidimicrobiia bacterium]